MKDSKDLNFTTIISSFSCLLLLLVVVLGCVENGQTTQETPSPSSNDRRQATPSPTVRTQTAANEIIGKVVGVSDGDTITVLDEKKKQHKIRFQGIDAPESGQPFGQAAKQNLSNLVFGKTVKVLIDKKDHYGREVGTVFHGDKDINLEQVKAGFAWHYKKYEAEQSKTEREEYAAAETFARTTHSGLWRDTNPIAPEEWRGGRRNDTAKSKTRRSSTSVMVEDENHTTTTSATKDLTVFITRTGEKYHRAGCRFLSRSQIPISLADAKASYDACSVCNPPR